MFTLTYDEGKFLVKLARNAISTFLKQRTKLPIPSNTPSNLHQNSGVFVTLNSVKGGNKRLRGCIGYPEPVLPLVEATITSAINSATSDPRFPPLSREELEHIEIEVSVLTPPELIVVTSPKEYIAQIEIGRDGLIVEYRRYKGLLLPQVPLDWGWNAEEFLNNCCMKAGLSPDAWLVEGTKVYKFSCVIAQETSPDGKVSILDMRMGEKL